VVITEAVENNWNGVGLSFESLGCENLIAILAIPKLDGFEFLFAFAFFYDVSPGAVETALLVGTDYALHILCYEFVRKRSRVLG